MQQYPLVVMTLDTDEETGQVYHFCSHRCRADFIERVGEDMMAEGLVVQGWPAYDEAPAGTVCDFCGLLLVSDGLIDDTH